MPATVDPFPTVIVDVFTEVFSALVGRPLQRVRARRLARRGKFRCALFGPENPRVLPTRRLFGAAEVWEGRIKLFTADLWIQGVEGHPERGPRAEHSDGDLLFRPKTLITRCGRTRGPSSGRCWSGRLGRHLGFWDSRSTRHDSRFHSGRTASPAPVQTSAPPRDGLPGLVPMTT